MLFNLNKVAHSGLFHSRMTENLQNRQQSDIERIEGEFERIQDGYAESHLSCCHLSILCVDANEICPPVVTLQNNKLVHDLVFSV